MKRWVKRVLVQWLDVSIKSKEMHDHVMKYADEMPSKDIQYVWNSIGEHNVEYGTYGYCMVWMSLRMCMKKLYGMLPNCG